MKILHIAPIGHHAEGIGSVLNKLVPRQNENGNEVEIVSVYENKIYKGDFVKTINNRNSFKKYIHSWQPDIVIFHSLYLKEYICFAKLLTKEKIPYLLQLHGALSINNYRKHHIAKLILNALFFNKLIKKASSIIYLNKEEYNNSIVKNINNVFDIIPNGCETHELAATQDVKMRTIRILFIGRLSIIHKGLDILVEAIRLLKSKNAMGFHINFYGNENDPDVDKFKKMLVGVNEYASYGGGVYGEEKRRVLRNSNIMILTSRFEGMPMGLLEALSFGIPCIVTPGTNMADVIQEYHAGWVAELNANSIAEKIQQAILDYSINKEQLRINAHNLSKKYEWREIAIQSLSVYKKYID